MGPIVLLDKSAVEMLSVDESIWLDEFFYANICPTFYAETLADLTKTRKGRDSSEQLVGEIAAKTPANGVAPCMHHRDIIEQDLLGNHPSMDNRPIVRAGKVKKEDTGRYGMDMGEFPETKALQRWQNQEFELLEKEFALSWRRDLEGTDYERILGIVKNIIPTDKKLSDLEQVKAFVDEFVANGEKELLYLMVEIFGIDPNLHKKLIEAYEMSKSETISNFAPYASYVLRVDLFFYLSIIRGFISGERASNRLDMSYLYYLPFCQVFVSRDKLHARTVPLFCELDQLFVSGDDMKQACKEMDEYYSQFQTEIEERGLMSFVGYPPYTLNNVITRAWDKFCVASWRDPEDGVPPGTFKPIEDSDIDSSPKAKAVMNAEDVSNITGEESIDFVTVTSHIKARRGKYRMISQDIVDASEKQRY